MRYTVKKAAAQIKLDAAWDSAQWSNAETVKLTNNVRIVSDHAPDVQVKMLYDKERICGLFKVEDRYVVARATANQQQVCQDSCVEFFVRPAGEKKYFNFEMNCGGTILLYHCVRCVKGQYIEVPEADLATIERYHTMPALITEEITEPVTWYLGFGIPVRFFEKYSGIDPDLSGQLWHGNFTKCADKCSHPHWLSWAPLSKCNFHLFDEFQELYFE